MANSEHQELLRQGVGTWNEWRKKNADVMPDFSDAHLKAMDLSGAYLRNASFRGADLTEVNFRRSYDVLQERAWNETNPFLLVPGDYWLDGIEIAMGSTDLRYARFEFADLGSANLQQAVLTHTYFVNSVLINVDLSGAFLGDTIFCNVDLSNAELKKIEFRSPCSIDIRTLKSLASSQLADLKRKREAESFLRGCGLSDWEIEAANLQRPELSNEEINDTLYRIHYLRAHQAIQINPLFISYSHRDSLFVEELEKYLNEKGIRFWRDVHHAAAGRLEKQVDRAIRLNPIVLLVLSANSINSDWVQHEVRIARKLEIEIGRDVLCPVALDNGWVSCNWPERLREQIQEYNILDFSSWPDKDFFHRMFARLIEGLDLFY